MATSPPARPSPTSSAAPPSPSATSASPTRRPAADARRRSATRPSTTCSPTPSRRASASTGELALPAAGLARPRSPPSCARWPPATSVLTSMIGLGYYDTITPPVIRRNVLENPAWYTAYTPYQPEISQGRLEALLNFQTMVEDLTGLPVAGASMLDEAHRGGRGDGAGAPDAAQGRRHVPRRRRRAPADARRGAHPGRAAGPRVVVPRPAPSRCPTARSSACSCSTRARPARCATSRRWSSAAHERGALLSRSPPTCSRSRLLTPPGEFGADIAVGTPSASACRWASAARTPATWRSAPGLERQLPGRLVGVSVDADGRPAYRLALQTREQHIRREKATCNICTAQVLLAVIAGDVRRLPRPGRAAARSPSACTGWPAILAAGLRDGRRRRPCTTVLRHGHRAGARPAPSVVAAAARRGASTCGWSTPTPSASPATRRPRRATCVAVLAAFGARRGRRATLDAWTDAERRRRCAATATS